jgi:2-hydroxychromene-2-carboxylate isomerase
MLIKTEIRSAMMRRIADPARRERRRAAAESRRQRQGRPHEVLYFHQPDDPYSQLAAQVLERFCERYTVRLLPRVTAAPAPIAIHDKKLWDDMARRECAAMAPYYGLDYADRGAPDTTLADLACRVLLQQEGSAEFAATAITAGHALHAGDRAALEALAGRLGAAAPEQAKHRLDAAFALRRRLGHYLGAMFHYEGEWYWGIDRLHYLEARLDVLGARRPQAPPGPSAVLRRRAPPRIEDDRRIALEFFPSLRSPYTQLSYPRVRELAARYPVELAVRPVMPMMMRGVKADRRKGVYILQDTKREAERLGVAFGDIWDPFGEPVKRAYSLFPYAREQGKALEYLEAYSMAVWAERVDAWGEAGLRRIVERAGLSWKQARAYLDRKGWEPELERNVAEMLAAGSWGVPSLRLPPADGHPEFTVWGQDRIWLIEEEIARRLGH